MLVIPRGLFPAWLICLFSQMARLQRMLFFFFSVSVSHLSANWQIENRPGSGQSLTWCRAPPPAIYFIMTTISASAALTYVWLVAGLARHRTSCPNRIRSVCPTDAQWPSEGRWCNKLLVCRIVVQNVSSYGDRSHFTAGWSNSVHTWALSEPTVSAHSQTFPLW